MRRDKERSKKRLETEADQFLYKYELEIEDEYEEIMETLRHVELTPIEEMEG